MTSDVTTHTATRLDCDGDLWEVTWLPDRVLSRNEAITAVTFAETVASVPAESDLRPGLPVWPVLAAWAGELGLTPAAAVALLEGCQ
ncbi:hypothetical protein G1H11_11050 [Phytoactinopolyspora alkaliphila]|uniref:Uncharacterized protein n=2 Tax=Phytoactinopolyspora alkaliphila TaxID=1783498 RepID=A0A6N9YLW7_9ACTN|nr:hypothetical protein [Phytoactinopolyspora alkaliphila]